MGGKETIRVDDLMDELERIVERYCDDPIAVEALEAIKFWAIEESVLDAGPGDFLCV